MNNRMNKKKKKKNMSLQPRRKRMKRTARLQSARSWLAAYKGKRVVRSYAKWFAVDRWCAVLELRMLGVDIDPAQASAIEASTKKPKRAKPVPDPTEVQGGYGTEWDENFSYIAGFTSGGAPFGVPWDPTEPRPVELEHE